LLQMWENKTNLKPELINVSSRDIPLVTKVTNCLICILRKSFTAEVLFQESIFPFKNSTVISSAHPKLPFAEPLFPHLAPPLAPDSPHDFPSSPLSSHDIPSPANDSSDYHSSPSSHTISPTPVDHTDCDIHVSSTPVRTEPYTRKSTRPKARSAWLKDYICTKPSSTVPISFNVALPAHSTSQSHSFTSLTPYPLFLSSHLAHLSSSYVASLVNVLSTPDPKHYFQAHQYPEWEWPCNKNLLH